MAQSPRASTHTPQEPLVRQASLARSNQAMLLRLASSLPRHAQERARWPLQSKKDHLLVPSRLTHRFSHSTLLALLHQRIPPVSQVLAIRWSSWVSTLRVRVESTLSASLWSTPDGSHQRTVRMDALKASSSGLSTQTTAFGTTTIISLKSWLMAHFGKYKTHGERTGDMKASHTSA